MTERFNPSYTLLTSEQVEKLPWNRLKNIMNSVRAVISSIERYHGQYYCDICDMRHVDSVYYKSESDRDIAVENILQPHKEYFHMLKSYANKLPHTDSCKPNKKVKK